MAKKKAVKPSRGNQMTTPQPNPTIEDFFKNGVEALKEIRGEDALEYYDLDTKSLNRRIRSVRNHAERATREFGLKYQEIRSIEARLASFESVPHSSFDSANYMNNVYLGAALWILDELKKSSRIHEIYRYLPQDFDLLMDAQVPWDFHDVSYDEDLIRSVMIVLAARNGEDAHHNFDKLVTERISEKQRKLLPNWREEYDAIIGLLDHARVEQACESFREKQWDFLDRLFKGVNCYSKKENLALRAKENIEKQRVNPMLSGPLAVKPNAQTLLPGLGGFTGYEDEMLKEWARIEIELENAHRETTEFEFAAIDYCHMSLEKVLKQEKSRLAAESITSFQPGNPYEVCFAFLYLLDLDDDDVWLHNTSLAVINAAGNMLPWSVNEPEPKEDDDDFDEMTFNGTHWLEGDNKDEIDLYNTWYKGADFGFDECDRINLAQLIYKLSKGVAPREMHPFQEARKKNTANDPNVGRAIDMAEILFLSAFESKSASYEAEMEWPSHAIDTIPEEEPEENTVTTTVPLGGYWGSVAGQIGLGGIGKKVVKEVEWPSEEAEHEDDKEDLAEENRRLQDEIKKLKKALYDTGRSVKTEKKQLEQERETAAREHRELADLRELIFNQQEGKYEDEEETERICFPYSTQHRTVVFGGHDSWAREIKPKLPGVRFVDANAAPNADLIRNADVVWIQTNRIGHSDFYKIIDEIRKHNIPLRYFTFASATKCAEQLALADQK